MKFGETGVSVCIDDFGENGPECFTEGTVIYINQEHPLYQREVRKPETHLLNVNKVDYTRNFIAEGYQKPAPGFFETKQTPPGCVHRTTLIMIRCAVSLRWGLEFGNA
jgi:hypothetical protein